MSRITKEIKYNLKDRQREHTGQDRSDLDVDAMVRIINSPEVQEMVAKGDMLGFPGHQIRQRFGLMPPESVIVDGKVVRLEPATRTVYLKADPDGTVTHKQEFLDNDAGNHAQRQYSAGVGGFSTACDYITRLGKRICAYFGGFDYVFQPNYAGNTSYGQFDSLGFDSTNPKTPEQTLILQMLERQIAAQYDSIHSQSQILSMVDQVVQRNIELEKENLSIIEKATRRAQLQAKKQELVFDNAICPTRPFSEMVAEAETFFTANKHLEKSTAEEEEEGAIPILGKWLGSAI